MVKVNEIKVNKSTPMSTPQTIQSSTPTTTNQSTLKGTPAVSTNTNYNTSTDPLWKQSIRWVKNMFDKFDEQIQSDKAKLKEELETWSWIDPNITTPYKPQDTFEQTAWGWNYEYDRAVSQQDNQQWHYNALNGTGHVVGIPEGQTQWLLYQSEPQQKWKRIPMRPWILPEEEAPVQQTQATPVAATPVAATPAKQTTSTPKKTTPQQTQPEEQPKERIVTPDEFGFNNKSIEEVQQDVQANEEAIANMQADLNKSTSGELYGKVTADQSTYINTLEDANSVYKAMNDARIKSFKDLQTMDDSAIAAAIVSNALASDSQQMRDLMQYDPAKYEAVQQQVKQLKWQMTINSIANWDAYPTFNNGNAVTNQISDFASNYSNWTTSTADILKNVNSTLNSNEAASTASETMASIESDMAVLQNRLKNLKNEANKVFKWDVPQYIVNAYISNRTAEIQDQMSILENRYNAAQSRYQQEWEQTKWAAEFDLKKQELALKRESMALDDWSTRQWIALKWAELNGTTNGVTPLTTLSVQESMNILSNFSSSYATNSYWWQCGTFVKRYLSQLWINLPNVSSIDSKMSLIDPSIKEPNQWDIVIMDSTKYPENWHMAIVESVDDDGTIHLLESNWNNDELVHRRTIKPNNSQILWYYRPTGWTSATTSGSQWWTWIRKDWEWFDLTNAPTYNALTYDQQNIVKWLLNLTINPATITKRQYWDDFEKIKSAVIEINPNWQESDFWQADKVKKEWNTSTKNGSNSRNWTAIATAKELYEMSDLLWNTKFTDWNDMMNYLKKKLSNENFIRFRVKLWTLASEYAWALKGNNAAPTEKEIEEARQQIAENLSGGGIRAAAIEMTRSLYNKNANEADNYKNVTLEKPNLIVTKDVADWMYDVAWITTLPDYYNYMPSSWWAVVVNTNSNLSNQDMVYNIFS